MKNYLLFILFAFSLVSINAQTNNEKEEGLQIINMFRYNYEIGPLQLDKNLTEYAQKKAFQILNDDLDEIIVSKANVGLLYSVFENEEDSYSKISRSILDFIDVDCDEKNRYDLFNQVIDDKSSKIGIAMVADDSRSVVVFIFDNYVYNQEVNKEKN